MPRSKKSESKTEIVKEVAAPEKEVKKTEVAKPVDEPKAKAAPKKKAAAVKKETAPKTEVIEQKATAEPVKKATAKKTAEKKTAPAKETKAAEIKIEEKKTESVKPAEEIKTEPKKPVEEKKAAPAKKILFVTAEAGPFIRTGGLGDVSEALPKTLNELGADTRVILPLYYDIPESLRQTMTYIGNVYVTLAWRYQYCGLFMAEYEGVTYYFIDNEQYFKRNGIYGHYDDAERFAFFSRAVLECLRLINYYPDVIHSNDWQAALVPVYLDTIYREIPEYRNIKTVFTIHNIEFQGKYGTEVMENIVGLPENKRSFVMYSGLVNFMKGAIEASNAVTTVSPSYANEIMDRYYSYGMDMILKERAYKLSGIVNGIDTKLYNPKTDRALVKNYDFSTIEDKAENKQMLLRMFGMEYHPETPLIGMVTRLTEQKGLDLLVARMDAIMQENVQMIILGKGDWKYENQLQELQNRYPGKLKVIINFSTDIANKIYAGSDMFLMPSKFEPCGLSQMIAMRYGTVPIVRRTGGLNDTVQAFNATDLTGDGFNFYSYNADDMLDAVKRAIYTYGSKREWIAVVANAMNKDFSWEASAKKYLDLYNSLK